MKTIPLSRGKFALVDDDDYERVSVFKWSYATVGYAFRNDRANKAIIYLHRLIVAAGPGDIVDHINRDGLDCQKANLRIGDKCLNSINRGPQSNNTSGHRGVDYDKARGKWTARIKHGGKARHLGRFSTLEDALAARLAAEAQYYASIGVRQ